MVPEAEIGRHISSSVNYVLNLYHRYHDVTARGNSARDVKAAIDVLGPSWYSTLDQSQADKLVGACFWKAKIKLSEVDVGLSTVWSYQIPAVINFYKLVFVHLWTKKVFLAPLGLSSPIHADKVLDAICRESDCVPLQISRSVNIKSSLTYSGKIDFEKRNRRASFWQRLLMSTTFYTLDDINRDDCRMLIESAYGPGNRVLRRYYVTDFLLSIADRDDEKISLIASAVEAHDAEVEKAKVGARDTARRIRKENVSAASQTRRSKATQHLEVAVNACVDYVNGDSNQNIVDLITKNFGPMKVKPLFGMESQAKDCLLYSRLPREVQMFSGLINGVMRSAIRSKRLQRGNTSYFSLNVLLSYVAVYLPRFYIDRDGGLHDYPQTLNDFPCSLFITRDSVILDSAVSFQKQPPMTFLKYLDIFARSFNWVNETTYARIGAVEHLFDYVQKNQAAIPNAEKVTNTFTPACYPRLQKKLGTVKRPLPRAYFGTFVSMLYSLEYLVMHINYMLTEEMPGLLDGGLYNPSYLEMCEHYVWRGLWGGSRQGGLSLDISMLNYTPIFYHEGKAYRVEYVPRFFRKTEYMIDGARRVFANPNHVRTTILMCETGIRQHHIIWLDKDKYDCALDRSSRSYLAPLFVNSDKSHGEWTAIVLRRVIDVLDRQRSWYEQSGSDEYDEDVWYGMKEGAKFGKFKPLFRQPFKEKSTNAPNSWTNHTQFPVLLLALQYFIRVQIQDHSCEDLVFLKREGEDDAVIADYSFESLAGISINSLKSKHTPHALRAGFVSDAIRFLPPSIIGTYMTGQTEALVMYYAIFDPDDMPDHQQLLANYLTKNIEKLASNAAPDLTEAVGKLNSALFDAIRDDPVKAIEAHGLMSLAGVRDDANGLDALRAKRYTRLAFNAAHICPFDNTCPREVVDMLGPGRPCALCPYAIRGVDHLPAVSAEKDKCKELMLGVLRKILEYQKRDPKSRSEQVMENLNVEHEKYAREGYALEAIEQQLYMMARAGQRSSYFLTDKKGLVSHFEKLNLTQQQHFIKRLVDVQNFPDASSPELDVQFAYMRMVLLMRDGNLEDILKISPEGTPASLLSSQIQSMVGAGSLDIMDLFKIGNETFQIDETKPVTVISEHIEKKT